ncbi:uncharacterized protein BJ171DRAFT_615853 [Polychytrium aggregatum]|uniref:uncharacterized protein n=1 Tax=Polychytrium aggregatum TaxID=110093 RepID=UPI0022FDC9B5|nr:uncharacterized protein BJ171DRAFT_615853 [Polychytrium aggregatum]KAI9205266.1 hypothetical protein BJ171DRAFT_615853 [Polychytrium aggregatum]
MRPYYSLADNSFANPLPDSSIADLPNRMPPKKKKAGKSSKHAPADAPPSTAAVESQEIQQAREAFTRHAEQVRRVLAEEKENENVVLRVQQVDWDYLGLLIHLPKNATIYRLQCEIARHAHDGAVHPGDIIIYRMAPGRLTGTAEDEASRCGKQGDETAHTVSPSQAQTPGSAQTGAASAAPASDDRPATQDGIAERGAPLAETEKSAIKSRSSKRESIVCSNVFAPLADYFPEIKRFRIPKDETPKASSLALDHAGTASSPSPPAAVPGTGEATEPDPAPPPTAVETAPAVLRPGSSNTEKTTSSTRETAKNQPGADAATPSMPRMLPRPQIYFGSERYDSMSTGPGSASRPNSPGDIDPGHFSKLAGIHGPGKNPAKHSRSGESPTHRLPSSEPDQPTSIPPYAISIYYDILPYIQTTSGSSVPVVSSVLATYSATSLTHSSAALLSSAAIRIASSSSGGSSHRPNTVAPVIAGFDRHSALLMRDPTEFKVVVRGPVETTLTKKSKEEPAPPGAITGILGVLQAKGRLKGLQEKLQLKKAVRSRRRSENSAT